MALKGTAIAVSGSHGFIGGSLVSTLEARGFEVTRLDRDLLLAPARAQLVRQLAGLSAVVHCAGLTPRRGRRASPEEFDLGNHQMTRNLGLAATDAGVARLVFVSSIAAIGGNAGILTPDMPHRPVSAYGRSKADAETALLAINGLQSIVARPPLVYGPGPKGDLSLLLRLCASPLPLPFGAVDNRRSMVGVTNLVDALCFLATSRNVGTAPHTLHVSDGAPLSLRDLVSTIRNGLGQRAKLFDVSPILLDRLLRILGARSLAEKLLGNLEIDISALLALGWRPPVAPGWDLEHMARALARKPPL